MRVVWSAGVRISLIMLPLLSQPEKKASPVAHTTVLPESSESSHAIAVADPDRLRSTARGGLDRRGNGRRTPTSTVPENSMSLPSSSTRTTCWLPRLIAWNALAKKDARVAAVPISSAPKPAVKALPVDPTEERTAAGSPVLPGTELRMLTPGAEMSTEVFRSLLKRPSEPLLSTAATDKMLGLVYEAGYIGLASLLSPMPSAPPLPAAARSGEELLRRVYGIIEGLG